MPEIIIDLNGFTAEFPIYKAEGAENKKIGYCNLGTIYDVAPALCRNYSINKIHIFSNNETYAKGIAEGLANTKEYSNFKIEVEIN